MGRAITRRDFLHDSSLAALGLTTPLGTLANAGARSGDPAHSGRTYPPTKTGLRGSHPGTYDVPHALALEGRAFDDPEPTGAHYDLVVVGGGISGLAAALHYQDRFGADARILILENHDDFGGHAKRNEFHQGGEMRLALGGVHNLEYEGFSPTVDEMMGRLGIDMEALKKATGFYYGEEGRGAHSLYFDAEHFGEDVLINDASLFARSLLARPEIVEQMPLEPGARDRFRRFLDMETHVFEGQDWPAIERRLRAMSYFDFAMEYGGLEAQDVRLFNNCLHGTEGPSVINFSAMEGLELGLPGWHILGEGRTFDPWEYPMAMFPDGNASVARLMVRQLIPAVSPGATFDNIALADFDYDQLDQAAHPVQLRLNATVVRVRNTDDGVALTYVRDRKVLGVTARHAVLACYHSIIPHLCPDLPEAQREAQRYQVKMPLLLTNVLLRDSSAWDASGASDIWCPGRMHARIMRWEGNTAGGYEQGRWGREGAPLNLAFWGSVEEPPGEMTLKERLRAQRARMLSLTLEDYEREVRITLDGALGPYGLDVKRDVLAITVNRWPHGYSYYYYDLWDPDFEDGAYPHDIARKPFGNITIANADAAADAYTHTAIDEAYRAVEELPDV
jgi:spermidine dehydrogenase